MTELTTVRLTPPYLILIGAEDDATNAKTGLGIAQWRPERVAGQLRFPGCSVDLGVPDMTVADAARAGVVAVVQPGGSVKDQEVIDAADGLGLVMLFTGTRHFFH